MRFNQVFVVLLLLSAASAFVGGRFSEALRPNVGVLLTPVAQPSRAMVAWATGRLSGPAAPPDDRPLDAVARENFELRQLTLLQSQELIELRRINGARENLGNLRDRCTPVTVVGSVPGNRESLLLGSGTFGGIQDGMCVLYNQDVVGKLISGKGGSQVRLVTDPQTAIECSFGTFRNISAAATQPAATAGFTRFDLPPKVLLGAGNGRMICVNLPLADVKRVGLEKGDWAILEDASWPPEVRGRRVGVVAEIRVSSRMMAEIEVRPERNLLELREVMVLTKEK